MQQLSTQWVCETCSTYTLKDSITYEILAKTERIKTGHWVWSSNENRNAGKESTKQSAMIAAENSLSSKSIQRKIK